MVTDREEHLAGRLGTALPSERAAADRNWRALAARVAVSPGSASGRARSAAIGLALAIGIIAIVGYWQGARLDVAGDHLPVLYREEVARTGVTSPGVEAMLAVVQKHVDGPNASRLSIVGVVDVRLAETQLPATIELRYQQPGDDSYGVLARSKNLIDARRATGTTRTLYEAPFPPLGPREQATYRVWIHIDTPSGPVESPVLVIQATDRQEGQRGTNIASP